MQKQVFLSSGFLQIKANLASVSWPLKKFYGGSGYPRRWLAGNCGSVVRGG